MKIKLLQNGCEPTKGTPGSAGLDLYASYNTFIPSWSQELVPVGIEIAIPDGYVGLVWPRSGWDSKHGITTGAGVIDSDHRREIQVLLRNLSHTGAKILAGDRIAQLVVAPCVTAYTLVDKLPEPDTEHKGFGSTGR